VPERPLIIRADGRPYPGETVSGDGWAIDWDEHTCRVALIDGLGHGPLAYQATEAAIACLSAYPALSPAEALRRCHVALRGTRGAAISIAQIDALAGRLSYAGVGNVEARLWRDDARERPIAFRGIVGVTLPTIRTFDFTLGEDWTLLLHTDGISARFTDQQALEEAQNDPLELVPILLQCWSRTQDDATAVVVRPRPAAPRA
jgi:hypothetical protein